MTEKNIFVNKLFLSLNISDFSLFFLCKNCYPSKKLSSCQVPPFLKIWSEAQPPPPPPPSRKGEGVHTMLVSIKCYNLHSFTERVILLCDSIHETRRISHLCLSSLYNPFNYSLKYFISGKRSKQCSFQIRT